MSIIKKIQEYNKEKGIEISKIINLKNNYTISFKNDLLTLHDDKKNKVIVNEYIFFGIYQPDTKLWVWSSSIPGVSKKHIKFIQNIRNKSFMFESDDNLSVQFAYQLLTQDVILIHDTKNLNLINDILNYMSDGITVLNPVNEYDNTQFIGLTKIVERYV